ncbi:MAG: hypothetical protein ACRC78_18330 [Planktothrix sp.]
MKNQEILLPFIVAIWDNQGTTLDRFTAITDSGDVVGCSDNPFHPQGFGQYSHNVSDKWVRENKPYPKKCLKFDISKYIRESDLGKRVRRKKWAGLPKDVIQYLLASSK